MNIVQINTHDFAGGAGKLTYQLHQQFQILEHTSKIIAATKSTRDPQVIKLNSRPWVNTIKMRFENFVSLQYVFRRFPFNSLNDEVIQSADVINLHDIIGGFFNYIALPKLSSSIPVVWSLHNMWAFTGHCSYSYGCERWITGCYQCPLLKLEGEEIGLIGPEPTKIDFTKLIWNIKKALFSRSQLCIVTGSIWMKNLVEKSILAGQSKIVHIPDAANIDVFRPVDKKFARASLNIPTDVPVVMVYATNNPRKGLQYAINALEKLDAENRPWIVSVGQLDALQHLEEKFHIRDVGYLQSDIVRNLCQNAADLLLLPTLADNLPLTILDSLASGTPVISFDVGGVPDAVRHMETGYLAKYKDANDLANGIRILLDDDTQRLKMSKRCREIAVAEYSLELQAQRYVQLYESLIS